jgi:hypothetical protein
MKTHTLLALICLSLLTPSLFGQTNAPAADTNVVATPPQIPEEARKHFVMGTTLFKDAKTPDDYSQVESEFKRAADLAPQWPDARYNLGLAKEAAGDYVGAEADMKLYLQFKLPDDEARTVQDKIYMLEAKQEEAAKKQAADQQAVIDNAQAASQAAAKQAAHQEMEQFLQKLQGNWTCSAYNPMYISEGRSPNIGPTQVTITVTDDKIKIAYVGNTDPAYEGTVTGDDLASIRWVTFVINPPVAPIAVNVDKSGSRIYFKWPYNPYFETTFTR